MSNVTCTMPDCVKPHKGRGLCNMHYYRERDHGTPFWEPVIVPTVTVCQADGCDLLPRSRICPWCEMHYGRLRRNGTLNAPEPMTRKAASNGYMLVIAEGHPLAQPSRPWAYEHRMVLYDSIGPGEHPCHWCGTAVSWELRYPQSVAALVADHLDGDKQHNVAANLVPACNPCNSSRR